MVRAARLAAKIYRDQPARIMNGEYLAVRPLLLLFLSRSLVGSLTTGTHR